MEESNDRLVLRDRSTVAVLALLAIALIVGGLGFAGLAGAADTTERLVFGVFAGVGVLLVIATPFFLRTHVHVFDRPAARLERRVWRAIGGEDRASLPLSHVDRALVETDEDVDGDTHRIVLVMVDDRGETALPLRDYFSSAQQEPVAAAINRWLERR
ncbi:MAG: hypothetical protein AAFQ88_14235 [Pseudomonadota bacterium]